MKFFFCLLVSISLLLMAVFSSCRKENSCENCINGNKPPIANAGRDTTIVLPANSIVLDGSGSSDPDGTITSYKWTKIDGPVSGNLFSSNLSITTVKPLVVGIYLFELTVTDNGGLSAKDTIQVTVNGSITTNQCGDSRPEIAAQLIPIGNLSQARSGMAVASAGNKILFAGPGSTVDIFDIAANTWSVAQLSPGFSSSKRTWIGAVAAGNKIFLAGGQDDNGYSAQVVDIYDVSTNTWSVSQLSRQADGLAAAAVGDKVFFAGGNWGIYGVNTVDIYNLTTNTWSVASLSTQRNFITAVSVNNKVYFTGGDPWSGQVSNVIDIYDNNTATWSTSTLQVPRGYHAAVAVDDVLFFAGGKSSWGSPAICSVETLNVNTGARSLMNLSGPASWLVDEGQNAVVKDGKIIFFRHQEVSNKFDIYDLANNTWSVGVLPVSTKGTSIISVNNTVYVAGVFDGVSSNKVYRLQF